MGIFYENYTLEGFLGIALIVGAVLFLNEVTRRSKVLSIIIYTIVPVLLAILIFNDILVSPTGKTWFPWVNVISALVGVLGFMLIRFTKYKKSKFAIYFPVGILSLNILEAIYRELEVFFTFKELSTDTAGIIVQGGPWNVFNAIAGIFCIITLTGFANIKISKDKTKDMIWPDITWIYIVGYTLWNFAYVYACLSTRSMYAGLSILLAAMLAEVFFKRGAWLQHRAQILAIYAMFSLSVDFQVSKYFQVTPIYNEGTLMAVGVISFIFNLGMVIYMLHIIKTKKRNPFKDDLYVDSNYYKKTIKENNLIRKRLKIIRRH